MVADHLSFLHSECKPMVEQERKDDLENMYKLLKPIQNAQQVGKKRPKYLKKKV